MKTPSFSVLLPTNRLDLLFVDAMNSVSFDLSEDAEVLVVLNGEAIEAASKFDWSSFEVAGLRLLNSHAPGLVAALNLGISEARGEFIARMDADDVTLPGRFGVQLAFLRENPSYAAVGSQFVEVCAHGKTGRRSHLPRRLRNKPWPPLFTRMAHPTVMFRKDSVQDVGGYRADFLHAEDQDLWLRLLKVAQVGNLKQVFLKYRKHSNQVSVENTCQQQQGLIRTYLWNSGLDAYGGFLSEAESPRDYKALIRNSPELGWKRSITLSAAVDLWSFTGEIGSGVGKFVTQAITRPHIALLFLWSNRRSLFSAIQGSARCEACGV
jgi:glycosyltransferase involved in cell wall biosynthesis